MFVDCDLELGLPHAFVDLKMKGDICGTPYSQVSTAPGTPYNFCLPDPPLLPSKLHMSDATSSGDPSPRDAVQCFGMPPLASDLGKWAQKQVEAEYRRKREKEMKERRGEETHVIDNSVLRAETSGLAFRFSKRVDDVNLDIQAPEWGSEIDGFDCGDGWLQVGDLYLPMVLHGMCVVTPQSAWDAQAVSCENSETEALHDGPALTEDGHVIDLEGGGSIFFSSDPKLSQSYSSKLIMIEMMKAHKKSEFDRAAHDAEHDVVTEAVCSIDPNGIIRGAEALQTEATIASAAAERLKKFYRKRVQEKEKSAKMQLPVLCVNAEGTASAYLYLTVPGERLRRFQEKFRKAYDVGRHGVDTFCMTIDYDGIVRDFPMDDM
jgi:hypothetical protein